MITVEGLKESSYYSRLISEPDLDRTAVLPKKASLQHRNGIVALIDMLGTKELRTKKGVKQMHSNWTEFLSYSQQLAQGKTGIQGYDISAFSDTMFITAEGNTETLLESFGIMATRLIPKSINLGIPIRGCVAAGTFYQSGPNLLTGPAVTEAASYYNQPQWIGISACFSAHKKISSFESGKACYTKYDIPLKTSVERGGLAVNWPDLYNREHDNVEEELNEILCIIDCNLEDILDINASVKWRNTRDFLHAATGIEGRPFKSPSYD